MFTDESSHSKFDTFSLIKTNMNKDMSAARCLPIGKYFVSVKYECLGSKSASKETIVDLSLLPLAIRAQLVFECTDYLNRKIQTYKKAREANTVPFAFKNLELPHISLLAIDSYLVQVEINAKRDEIIKDALVKTKYDSAKLNSSLSASSNFTDILEFDKFMKTLELDLNSYYICEKALSLTNSNGQRASSRDLAIASDDLVKLNKLDALASYRCVHKYKTQFGDFLLENANKDAEFLPSDESASADMEIFYLIDNGHHYKCVIPCKDLVSTTVESRIG